MLAESAASWGMGREKRMSSGAAGTQHLTAWRVGEPPLLSKIDPNRCGAHLGIKDRDRERERGRDAVWHLNT